MAHIHQSHAIRSLVILLMLLPVVHGCASDASRGSKPPPLEPPVGMVAWWPGDRHAKDIVDGNHGSLRGKATYDEGVVDEAFSLNGTGDFVLVRHQADLNVTGDVTVDLWAKRTALGEAVMVAKGDLSGAAGTPGRAAVFVLQFGTDNELQAKFFTDDGASVDVTGPAVTDSRFHHYAYVRKGNEHRLYMDGTEVAESLFTQAPGDTTGDPLAIGAVRSDADPSGFFGYFSGILDEVEVFDRALAHDEIQAIFATGSSGKAKPKPKRPLRPPTGLVSWWSADRHARDIIDGNHATLQGAATYAPGMVGEAFSFDGKRAFVQAEGTGNLNLTGDVTIDLWAKRTALGEAVMVAKGDLNGAAGTRASSAVFVLGFGTANELQGMFFTDEGASTKIAGPAVTDARFHHYAYVREGSRHRLFMDGSRVAEQSFEHDPGDAGRTPLVIGAARSELDGAGYRSFFSGTIDEIDVFSRALTDAEIKAIYSAGPRGKRKPK